jgi:pimeloyl-ACP methyl ester carboxylesterase
MSTSLRKEPFVVHVSDDVLADLRDRLRRTRWPRDFNNSDWRYGTELEYLRELVDYWIRDFNWRRVEAQINSFSHYKTEIDGIQIHFIHEPGKGPKPIPLIVTHGWPWTFWDINKVIRPLADPGSHGGDPLDAFDVVVPSLPGYGFSTPLTKSGINYWRTADLWTRLMQEVLGYGKFGAQGGDWGAIVTHQLGHKYADKLIGVHMNMAIDLNLWGAKFPAPSEYSADERGWYEQTMRFITEGSGYSAIQTTRPQTLAYGLNDSPVGLCAWILEKRRAWSDCGGDVEKRFTKDELLTAMTLYWATESFGTSARFYYEAVHERWQPSHNSRPIIAAPTAIAVFPREVILMPLSWAEGYYNLKRWTRFSGGGHFAHMEEPQALVEDIRAFFRTFR